MHYIALNDPPEVELSSLEVMKCYEEKFMNVCCSDLAESLNFLRGRLGEREEIRKTSFNPLVPDAHYIERQDKLFPLQIQQLEVNLQLYFWFYFYHPGGPMQW